MFLSWRVLWIYSTESTMLSLRDENPTKTSEEHIIFPIERELPISMIWKFTQYFGSTKMGPKTQKPIPNSQKSNIEHLLKAWVSMVTILALWLWLYYTDSGNEFAASEAICCHQFLEHYKGRIWVCVCVCVCVCVVVFSNKKDVPK